MRRHIALLHRTGSGYSVSMPDFPGLVSAGGTIEEAVDNAAQGLRLHVSGMTEDGVPLPAARSLDAIAADPEFAEELDGAVVTLVPLVPPGRSVRVNITMDDQLLGEIDARTDNRSAFLAEAARRMLM